MSKLKSVGSRLVGLRTRIGQIPKDEVERTQHRDTTQPWRAWYKTAKWQRLKAKVHKRDLYTCQKTGVLVTGKYPAPNSAVADHKKPHRGDPVLFWDEDNIETVSKAYHDAEKQRQEQSEIKGVWY
jgi:5-methylcytosine-specific restriction protein A